jgi:HlyD family secretion protein
MKKLLFLIILAWGLGGLGVWFWADAQTGRISYRTALVQRGSIRTTINATGTIEPEEVVDVGAQVAGKIVSFGTEANDPARPIGYGSRVDRGSILARLDPTLYKARVDQAIGKVERAKADIQQAKARLQQSEREFERASRLHSRGGGMIAPQDHDLAVANLETSKAALAVCQSGLVEAQANLEEANANLEYTTIRSPVKGIILDRRINIGQTVVASLNAPSLFLIAKDLSRLEIWSSVNETDIGAIHPGQGVSFTVSAFPNDVFEGKVSQVRLNASMSQNVVTYTVVVAVDNRDGKLLPYLTARLQFEVDARHDVLLIPNAALRWQPRPEMIVQDRRAEFTGAAQASPESTPRARSAASGTLWMRQGDLVAPVEVRLGLSDGVVTEVAGDGISKGTSVVLGASRVQSDPDALSILPHTWTKDKKR